MKEYDLERILHKEIKEYLKYTGSNSFAEEDEFAVFINMVRSEKYSDIVLRQAYYKIREYVYQN